LYLPEFEPKAKRAKEILQKIENKELSAATSTLTWDEVVWVATKLLGRSCGIAQGQNCLVFPT
jgi:predicted nucleic acid-binding protein